MASLNRKSIIMDAAGIERALARIAREIARNGPGDGELAIVGIRTRGIPLGERLARQIEEIREECPPFGYLDITLYRDDLQSIGYHPVVGATRLPFDINGTHVVLVDDVLYTGRTVRAALSVLVDYGRPRTIQLAVLVDRGHRELPIRADYVGSEVPTSRGEAIQVNLDETDGEEAVYLCEIPGEEGTTQ
ncbi:MAG: bifunctional pyr operon transcriptional regulator/uracil phosphoribosyltransferase [Gemmatimonadetes bacterium]|nr:bifunctional pyr operon transcriptional regulator/uracil phosphoribosyltransferase [Gemmatimonadota bacterium]